MITRNDVEKIVFQTGSRCPDLADDLYQLADRVQASGNERSLQAFQAYAKHVRKRSATNHKNLKKAFPFRSADFWVRCIAITSVLLAAASIISAIVIFAV